MPYQELIVLLPCHSLEDFPTFLEEAEAQGLLAACTALWHPALLQSARKLPSWCRADVPPLELTGRLFVVPEVSNGWMGCDFLERARAEGATVVHGVRERDAIVAAALAHEANAPLFDESLVSDLFAIGFCRLHVELITRVMRYTSTIDDIRLQTEVLAALDAAIAGDKTAMAEALQRSFDQLCESRRYFFPVDPYLVDLILVAESTMGGSLRAELASPLPKNLLVCGQVLDKMAECETASVEAARGGLERGEVSLVGGEYQERGFPLLPEEVWREDLLRGVATYERVLGRRPIVYGRRRAGLSPMLPQLLCRTGFQAALHFTLDDGQFPTSPNSKVRWDSADGSLVEALAQVPCEAARSTPFLEFPRRLGEAMGREQVATLVFAHWPGMSSVWFDDLRRVGRYTPALGKFITLEAYFSETLTATNCADFNPDDYRMPYLQQAVAAGEDLPISRYADSHRDTAVREAKLVNEMLEQHLMLASPLLAAQDCAVEPTPGVDQTGQPAKTGVHFVLINPLSFPVVRSVEWDASYGLPDGGPEIVGSDIGGDQIGAAVEIPGTGFSWITAGKTAKRAARLKAPIIEGTILKNEFCDVTVSPVTGGIQAIHAFGTRGNRISQQIALRLPGERGRAGAFWRNPDEDAVYSRMVADAVEADSWNGVYGKIVSRGRIVDQEDNRLASFSQTTSLAIGSRIVELEIVLDIERQPELDPWNSYYAVRFAFPDTELEWFRQVGTTRAATSQARIESPVYIEAVASRWRTAILCGGLPFHRRVLGRTIETILVVRGESQRQFKLAIALDEPHPRLAAIDRLTPRNAWIADKPPAADSLRSGWFFHLNSRSVVATHWQTAGDDSGFIVRLQETAGAAGSVCLRSWRPIRTARQTDFLGRTLCELVVEHDKIWMEMNACQWIQVEVFFAS